MDIITVCTFHEPVSAELAKLRLEAEGIPCFLADQHAATMPTVFGTTIGIRLQVRECDKETALEILSQEEEPNWEEEAIGESEEREDEDREGPAEEQKEETGEQKKTQSEAQCPKCQSDRIDAERLTSFPKLLLTVLLLGLPLLVLNPTHTCKRCGHIW